MTESDYLCTLTLAIRCLEKTPIHEDMSKEDYMFLGDIKLGCGKGRARMLKLLREEKRGFEKKLALREKYKAHCGGSLMIPLMPSIGRIV